MRLTNLGTRGLNKELDPLFDVAPVDVSHPSAGPKARAAGAHAMMQNLRGMDVNTEMEEKLEDVIAEQQAVVNDQKNRGAVPGVPATGGAAKGVAKTGKNAAGKNRPPRTGKAAKNVPKTGLAAKGVAKTGRSAKGVANTGWRRRGWRRRGRTRGGRQTPSTSRSLGDRSARRTVARS